MKIAAGSALRQRAVATKANLRLVARECHDIVFTEDRTQLGTAEFSRLLLINTALEVQVYFVFVESDPFRIPAFDGIHRFHDALYHELKKTERERESGERLVLLTLYVGGLLRLLLRQGIRLALRIAVLQ